MIANYFNLETQLTQSYDTSYNMRSKAIFVYKKDPQAESLRVLKRRYINA